MASEFLTTGEVARLCGVSRDAVVKWIKKGTLRAIRTPGGHYRVPREVCDSLSREARGKAPVGPEVFKAEVAHIMAEDPSPLRCWEYFGEEGGTPRDGCKSCLVYLARAQKCYRLAELGEESGHRLHFCRNDCRSCAYYRACQGLATEVLMVTGDEALTHRLQTTVDAEVVSMRFARSGYESSTIISTFSPALIVLDSSQPEVAGGELLSSMMRDDRIPGARVAVALREGDEVGVEDEEILTLRAPFTAEEIESLAVQASGRVARIPKDVA
jgi:excisionase family DNA binding protein